MSADSFPASTLLDTAGAARYLGLSKGLLNNWRTAGEGPKWFKVGAAVRYRVSDIEEWLQARRFQSTTEAVAGNRADNEPTA